MDEARTPRVFRPRLVPTVAAAVVLLALLGLGRWQLERAEQKRLMVEAFHEASHAASVVAPQPYAATLPRFSRVTAAGRWDGAHQFLVDAAVHEGQVGFHVLTPLVQDDGRVLLVDRGWIAGDAARHALPEITLPAAMTAAPAVTTGLIDEFPRAGIALGAAAPSDQWPRVVLYPTPAELSADLGAPVEPLLLRLDPALPGGYAREFTPDLGISRERHLGYSATWFLLAAALAAIWVVTNLEAAPTGASKDSAR